MKGENVTTRPLHVPGEAENEYLNMYSSPHEYTGSPILAWEMDFNYILSMRYVSCARNLLEQRQTPDSKGEHARQVVMKLNSIVNSQGLLDRKVYIKIVFTSSIGVVGSLNPSSPQVHDTGHRR